MQFRNPHTFGPLKSAFSTGFPRLSSENRTIEKREKWRQATRTTGDEVASQTSFQLLMWTIRLAGEKEENQTDDPKLRAFSTWDNP